MAGKRWRESMGRLVTLALVAVTATAATTVDPAPAAAVSWTLVAR